VSDPTKLPIEDPSRKDLYDQTEVLRQEIAVQVESIHSDSAAQMAQAESEHRINLILERLGTNETRTRKEIDNRFQRHVVWVIAAFLFLLSLGAFNYLRSLNPQPGQTLFILGDSTVSGSSDLCPGESLDFSVSVSVSEKGTYTLDMSTWQVDPPPATIIFSEGERMVLGDDRSFPITRKWVVPETYVDPATNERISWKPGKFSRDIAVTALGKNVESSTKSIPFTIREDCE
jgi:hypothetical protein